VPPVQPGAGGAQHPEEEAMRIGLQLLMILVFSGWARETCAGPVVRHKVLVGQLSRMSHAVTGQPRLLVPLLVAVDHSGSAIGYSTDWDHEAVERLVRSRRDNPASPVAGSIGISELPPELVPEDGRLSIVVFSIPGACPPCDALESRLEIEARTHPGVRFHVLQATLTPAGQ
jgi:hypothetical protein